MVFVILGMGHAKEECKIMKQRLDELSDGLERTAIELATVKGDLATTKDDLASAKNDLTATKDVLANTSDDLINTKTELSTTKAELIAINKKLETEVSILKTPPFLHACGSHYDYYYYYTDGPGIIPYTSLLYSSTNMEGGGLDINTGVFTAPQSGSYTVTWSTAAYIFHVQIFLYKNGEKIQESVTNSFEGGSSASYDQGKVILVIMK